MAIKEYGSGMRTIEDADPDRKGAIKRTEPPRPEGSEI
jgi:hypothetical protein